jgi:hypothetical protein
VSTSSSTKQLVSIEHPNWFIIIDKIKTLALLNSDFFEEVFKKEEEELSKIVAVNHEFHRLLLWIVKWFPSLQPCLSGAKFQTEQCGT